MPGLLDRRLAFYEPRDGGAGGFVRTVYVLTGTWWGRLDETADQETVPLAPHAHVEGRTTGVVTVSDTVPVPRGGVVRDVQGGALYSIRGIVPKRAARCQYVPVEHVSPTDFATYSLYDAVDVLDGVHLVTPGITPGPPLPNGQYASAFSSAFLVHVP